MNAARAAESWRISALLATAVALSAGAAAAEEPRESSDLSGTAYILNFDQSQGGGAGAMQSWLGLGAVTSPSGVLVPDASAYFDLGADDRQVTYLTPRIQGLQVSFTGDRSEESIGAGRTLETSSRTYVARPTSVGASYAKQSDDFEISLGGDYGRTPTSVPGAVRLVDDEKLLRVGAHARLREFTLGGAFGSDVEPSNLGQTLSWDAFGRYDFGSLAVGFVYNYTAASEEPSGAGGGIPGTLQGGVSYFFTPRMVFTTNIAYGNTLDQGDSDDAGIAGVLGFSLDF